MRKINFSLAVLFSLALFGMTASAQTQNFGGTWSLDKAQSKLDERARIESIKMTVAQTPADITITTETKRMPPPADAPQPPAGGGRGGRGGMMGGDGTSRFTLDGKETKVEIDGPMGKIPQTLVASMDGGKLMLSKSSTMSTQMGEMTIGTKETWSLSADGKTLTVVRDQSSPRGSTSSTMVFVKQ